MTPFPSSEPQSSFETPSSLAPESSVESRPSVASEGVNPEAPGTEMPEDATPLGHLESPLSAADIAASASCQRGELARMLVDVLALPAGQVNENERAFVGDILNDLLEYLDLSLLEELAQRLSTVLAPPPNLLRRLLAEPIGVAGPLITAFKDIPDSLLLDATHVSADHRLLIARRLRLPEVVGDLLLDADEPGVLEAVLLRDDIPLSEARMDQLLTRTMSDVALQKLLLGRKELQPRHGFTMFWWLDAELRRQVFSRYAIDRTVIQNALKPLYQVVFPDPDPDVVVKRALVLCDRRHRPRGKNGETVSPEMVERMLMAARADPTPEISSAVGLLAGVTADTASRAIFDQGGEPFAILCKSTGVSRRTFGDILSKAHLMREPGAAGPVFDEAEQDRLMGVFDMVARDYARAILRYWDWRRDTYATLAPVE